MKLTDEQNAKISEWIAEGKSLSSIQQGLADTFNVVMTYIDVRFLVDDLGLSVKEKPPAKDPADLAANPAAPEADGLDTPMPSEDGLGEEPAPQGGNVSVSVDRIVRPGAVVSGDVVFSDGVKAGWQLDQAGRIGLSKLPDGYRPSQADVELFQLKLQEELSRSGAAF